MVRRESPRVKLVIVMISSDPSLQEAHELVRINEGKRSGKCLVSVAADERRFVLVGLRGAIVRTIEITTFRRVTTKWKTHGSMNSGRRSRAS